MIVVLMLSISGCATYPSKQALCSGSEAARKAHAGALLTDGGPISRDTGERLLTSLKAGCEE